MKRRYGWRPSLPDHRDYRAPKGAVILSEVDPRKDRMMPVIWDQGSLGSCTANAVAAALQYNHGIVHGVKARRPSRLDIYYGERKLEGLLGQGDTGAYGRDGFKFAKSTGYLLERRWPYDIPKFQVAPPTRNAQDTGPARRIKLEQDYAAVDQDIDTIKACLSNKQTVAFGFTVYESFESEQVAETGIVPMPLKSESTLGGHEVLAVGYLQSHPDYVLCRNSWGTGWGIEGYFLMPWEYVCGELADDHRTIVIP